MGIIGPNGAGKTTILKILASVTPPTTGSFTVDGRFSALIALGAGFHPDLTGRENIYLNGTILGMKKAEIEQRFDEIVDFSGIEAYLDTPVKRYSSGMYARLGFSIAAHVDPDVMLVDEVLAVGDYAFQQKCYAKMHQLRRKGTALIFVSHNFEAVRRVCDKAIVLYQGRNVFEGSAGSAVVAYSDVLRDAARLLKPKESLEGGLSERVMTFDAEIIHVDLLSNDGTSISDVQSGDEVSVLSRVRFHREVKSPVFSMFIRMADGQKVYDTTTNWMGIDTPSFEAGNEIDVVFKMRLPLLNGEYELGVDVAAADFSHYYDRVERAFTFYVSHTGQQKGIVDLDPTIVITNTSPRQGCAVLD